MPKLTPVSWHNLVQRLRQLGFKEPYSGGILSLGSALLNFTEPSDLDEGLCCKECQPANISS